ncbi:MULTISPECIES: phytoene/squalene synthase family protein [Streptomyces]|uniref:phytoene/squalene synthase family protein n=1 Tax=Streptomyces TaxID=1883 RepID=UPI00103D38EF|nr:MULTISPECIES: phytoene/squalene synthase family protein [Streptomyces]MBT3075102.1 phytoene/squalene synthase family protein [Streptomyces sp. COG21]MBT3088938.1 phytoene/squalene synthase family protein [Streptomyces sp. CYG21]MBT3103930.1 phytoene/squalene synthase family protein [Streptomyces sp. COG19]MBT3113335.1 phytoene/squalene synthase family protein [Streptomyces sp. CYG20]MDI7787823.1 phytoene/squalene synthase family protein [Streptomyces cavourensis]
MTVRELDAAAVHDPALRAAYARCRTLNARHGRTYFLATRLLPVDRRPAVHALYGFARHADDIVDDLDSTASPGERARALLALEAQLESGLRRTGAVTEPVILALSDTVRRYGIDHRHFTDFLASMRSDLTVGGYASYDELGRYMHGSAAVIGLQMLPVLGTVGPREEAAPHAAALGVAFQLTNFLRDVGEDLDRGRLYLPAELLAAHGVDRERFEWSRRTGARDTRITDVLRAAAAHNRAVYRDALPGIAMLDPVSRPCIRTAFVLYSGILDAIEADGYAVLHRRSVVPRRRRAVVALDGLVRAVAARRAHRRTPGPVAEARPSRPRVTAPVQKEPV